MQKLFFFLMYIFINLSNYRHLFIKFHLTVRRGCKGEAFNASQGVGEEEALVKNNDLWEKSNWKRKNGCW